MLFGIIGLTRRLPRTPPEFNLTLRMNNLDPTHVRSHVVTTAIETLYRFVSAGGSMRTWVVWKRRPRDIYVRCPLVGKNAVSTK
jgi:hypothetical protein